VELLTEWEIKGQRTMALSLVLRQLTHKFGPLPPAVTDRVRVLSTERLEVLGEALLDFATIDDLGAWLTAEAPV
jgi:hypothetical protein